MALLIKVTVILYIHGIYNVGPIPVLRYNAANDMKCHTCYMYVDQQLSRFGGGGRGGGEGKDENVNIHIK